MFLGTAFAGGVNALSNTTAVPSAISTITLSNMVLDEIYATKNVLVNFNWNIPDVWDWDTMLHAKYNGNTEAGNITYSKDVIQKVKIKKRYKGDFNWKTIYEQDVNEIEDLNINFYDQYSPAQTDVEYAYVAVIANTDMNTIYADVRSEFDCYFICDADVSYPMILDVENNVTYNRESQVIVSPGRKYPYVNHNGIAKYYSGTMTATFIKMDDNCQFDVTNGWKYRNQIDEFLTNGKAKIIKSFEGNMWMVNTSGSISRSVNGHYQNVAQSFEWVECGDPNSIGDLYDNGFIDTDVDRE